MKSQHLGFEVNLVAASASSHFRKLTYRLYPTTVQSAVLISTLRSHQELYNAALEERISAWRKEKKRISYVDQCKSLTVIRRDLPETSLISCSSQQMTLRRLDMAFKAFFSRLQSGSTPGFPRYKSQGRFNSFGFKTHGDGWRFTPGECWKHGTLRIAGVGHLRCRGQARQGGAIRSSEMVLVRGQWFLSLTVESDCFQRIRTGDAAIGLDWGVTKLLTGVRHDGMLHILENPRWFQSDRDRMSVLHKDLSRKKRGSKRRSLAACRVAEARAKQARKRRDFLHKEAAKLASAYALVVMEDLHIKNMTVTAKGSLEIPGRMVSQKAGLNREILDTAPSFFMNLIRYKVLETGGEWVVASSRRLKPSQTCPACGDQVKKTLANRRHCCGECGYENDRDVASAQVVLNWALYGDVRAPSISGQELADAGVLSSAKLSLTRNGQGMPFIWSG